MRFTVFPWHNRKVAEDTPLNSDDLQIAERRLAEFAEEEAGLSKEAAIAAAAVAAKVIAEAERAVAEGKAVPLSTKAQPSGVASLDESGKVPSSQLPPVQTTSETYVVASEAAQLALVAKKGDFAVRTDSNKTYINKTGLNTSIAADWVELKPAPGVETVNGQHGPNVTLTAANVGAATPASVTAEETRAKAAEKAAEAAAIAAAGTKVTEEKNRAKGQEETKLAKGENLKDLPSTATARTNLGLGSSAVHSAADFVPAHQLTALGNVTGTVVIGPAAIDTFSMTLTGNVTVPKPLVWPTGVDEVVLIAKQDAAGGHTLTLEGVTWISSTPAFNIEPNATNIIPLFTPDGGATIYAINALEGREGQIGPTGAKGTTGATGATGPVGPPGATGTTVAHGEVEGTVKVDLKENHLVHTMTAKGNVTIVIENWPAGAAEPELWIYEDSAGGHTITLPAITWQNEAPELVTTPNALNFIPLTSPDGGVTILGVRGLIGPKGEKGTTGNTGPTGPTGGYGPGATTALVLPYGGTMLPTATAAIGTAFKAQARLCVVEKGGKLKAVRVYNGATINGNTRVAVYDTGQAVTGKYTLLGESASVTQTPTSAWQAVPITTPPTLTAGQVVILAVMNDGTTGLYGTTTTLTNTAASKVHGAAFTLGGIAAGMGSVFGNAVHTFAEMKYVTLAEGLWEQSSTVVQLVGEIE